jgi:ribosomal protein L34E
MTVNPSCADCGGDRLAYPFEVKDDAPVHCQDCGAQVGTIAEISERIMSEVPRPQTSA